MTAEDTRVVEVGGPHTPRRARRKRTTPGAGGVLTVVVDDVDLAPAVGANLRRLRVKGGLSIERSIFRRRTESAPTGRAPDGTDRTDRKVR
jgi:hypothetical protein